MTKGEIVLIPFPFSDLSGNKNRPALVLIDSEDDVTVCFITAQIKWKSEFDFSIFPSDINGLKMKSLIRLSKFATIDKDLIIGRLGVLEDNYLSKVNKNLIEILKLK